jgi:hypothetical protein
LTRILTKRFGVTIVALAVVVTSFSSLLAIPHSVRATRLLLVAPTSFVHLGQRTELTIKAIDDSGNLDKTRSDFAELSLRSLSYSISTAKLSATIIRLEKGVGSVYILSNIAEVVDVTVTWKEGQSSLRSFTIRLFIGI